MVVHIGLEGGLLLIVDVGAGVPPAPVALPKMANGKNLFKTTTDPGGPSRPPGPAAPYHV